MVSSNPLVLSYLAVSEACWHRDCYPLNATGCGLSVGGTVILWIERQEKSGSKAVLKLEGQLVGDWVSVLEEECRKILEEKKLLALEMAEVTYVSQRGVHLLRRLTAENVNLVNCSSLIENLL